MRPKRGNFCVLPPFWINPSKKKLHPSSRLPPLRELWFLIWSTSIGVCSSGTEEKGRAEFGCFGQKEEVPYELFVVSSHQIALVTEMLPPPSPASDGITINQHLGPFCFLTRRADKDTSLEHLKNPCSGLAWNDLWLCCPPE